MLVANIIFSVKQSMPRKCWSAGWPCWGRHRGGTLMARRASSGNCLSSRCCLMVDGWWLMIHDWSDALVTLVILNFDWLIYACLPPSAPNLRQVFLRSKALELALDASARSAELRLALRTYALAVPARWVMETGNGSGGTSFAWWSNWDSLKFCRMLKSRGWIHESKLNSEVLVPKDWHRWMRCMYIM